MRKNESSSCVSRWLPPVTYIIIVILLSIQVLWIFKAAKLEEQNFSHRVTMALREARLEISTRQPLCEHISMLKHSDTVIDSAYIKEIHDDKKNVIDSIIERSLSHWNIELPYEFCLTDSFLHRKDFTKKSPIYYQDLDGVLEHDGIVIKVAFPTRNQFLLSQFIGIFGLSIFFVFFIFYSFTKLSLLFRRNNSLIVRSKDFVNNIVHEFQTPIANVRFASGLINRNSLVDDSDIYKNIKYTEIIQVETERLQKLVDEILRIGAYGMDKFEKEMIDVNDIIDHQIKIHKSHTDLLNGEIIFKERAKHCDVKGNVDLFSVAISNLIDNSLKYVKNKPEIIIRTFNKSDTLIVTISDNGIGIAKQNIKNVFEKYYRVTTGDQHNVKGFGLGLSLVYRIVTDMGGNIDVKSKVNKGTIFTIFLPLNK